MGSSLVIDIWYEAIERIEALLGTCAESDLTAATACPGWNVADVVAHVIDIEQVYAGEPRPDIDVNWADLPHVTSPLGRITELGVQARKGATKEDLLTELSNTKERGRAMWSTKTGEVMGPTMKLMPIDDMVSIRIFDIWVHEQDIREALHLDGGWGGAPAEISARTMLSAIPKILAKKSGAFPGFVCELILTGSSDTSEQIPTVNRPMRWLMNSQGRIEALHEPFPPGGTATASIRMSWPLYARLAAGRIPADTVLSSDHIEIEIAVGDDAATVRAIAESFVKNLNVAP